MKLKEMRNFADKYADVKWGYYDVHISDLHSTDNANADFVWTLYDGAYYIQNRDAYAYAADAMNALPKLLKVAEAANCFDRERLCAEYDTWKRLWDALEELEK
jgi:hypothetical protein